MIGRLKPTAQSDKKQWVICLPLMVWTLPTLGLESSLQIELAS